MNVIFAIAGVSLKELYRRKDFYVLFVLTALITLVMGSANFFGDDKIVRYLKEICLFLIWISSLVIAITTSARQIPAEREARTIFPLLAKPVTRGQVIAGKFLGCWLASGLALFVFYLFLAAVSGVKEHSWQLGNYFQAIWLQWMMLAVVISMVLLGSIVFAAPSSNSTICLIVIVGIIAMGRFLNLVALARPEPLRSVIYTIYFLIPHLEWFNISDLVVHDRGLVAWWAIGGASLFAVAYTVLFLFVAWMLFRRKALN